MLSHALWVGVAWWLRSRNNRPATCVPLPPRRCCHSDLCSLCSRSHRWNLIPPAHFHTRLCSDEVDPYRAAYTLAFVFWSPPSALCLLCACIHLSTSFSCCQGTPRRVSSQLYRAFASRVHSSRGFEGFTGCRSDWEEYCVSVQRTARNTAHPYSLCIRQDFSLQTSFPACCSNFTKSIPIH